MAGRLNSLGRGHPLRRLAEAAILAAIAWLGAETWLAQGLLLPWRVEGGSMAPRLVGAHRRIVCPECRFEFDVEVASRHEIDGAGCHNCGRRGIDLERFPVEPGDRLWVVRTDPATSPPARWSLAVFRRPDRPSQICIKRVVGLPGEHLAIREGDLWINGDIARKSLAECRRMAILVSDANHQPTSAVLPPQRSAARWGAASSDSRWVRQGGRFSCRAGHGDRIDWLEFHQPTPSAATPAAIAAETPGETPEPVRPLEDDGSRVAAKPILPGANEPTAATSGVNFPAALVSSAASPGADEPARAGHRLEDPALEDPTFDDAALEPPALDAAPGASAGQSAGESRGEAMVAFAPISNDSTYHPDESRQLVPVYDLLLRCRAQADLYGTLYLRAHDGRDEWMVTLSHREEGGLLHRNGRPLTRFAVDRATQMRMMGGACELEFAVIDQQVLLSIDGKSLLEFPYQASDRPRRPVAAPLAIGVERDNLFLGDVRVYRDVEYEPAATDGGSLAALVGYRLGPREYLLLGDNCPHSDDSRQWSTGPGAPEQLILGKPLVLSPRRD